MKVIGITGGVGSGKSEVMKMIEKLSDSCMIYADDVANMLKEKGKPCYFDLLSLLGEDILNEEGEIDKKKMAARMFAEGNEDLTARVNEIVHPRVKQYILDRIDEENSAGRFDYFFIEAALLIEDGYDKICDELWYVYADEDVRRERLKKSRGYSDEKITGIFSSQNKDEVFRKHCRVIIENNGDLDSLKEQILRHL
ncbi:MAG: dephospho-CoA kinase [Lachnospiraceae bacterium]|nr:dephospho-CoA kinase [Lachnospiraceae bacterium]